MKKYVAIVNLINRRGKFLAFFLAALCAGSVSQIAAQGVPQPSPTIPPPRTRTTPPRIVTPRPQPSAPSQAKRVVVNESKMPAEKSIATEPKVSVNLCVLEGNVRINGWDRNEIRAYVEEGSQVGFKIVQENAKTKKPVWINVLGFDPQKNKEVKPEECLSGSDIELDVPRNAIIKLKSVAGELKIESVSRVWVENLGGDIYLNDIANGIDATTFRGDLTVENSGGQIVLTNNGDGNVIAVGASPSEVGDFFKAKTGSGRIVLKAVDYRLVETTSSTGSTSFDGELLSGGQYKFTATNGSILLAVPQESVCKINAVFGFGAFGSEIPLQNALKKSTSVAAQLGSEETTCGLNLTTSNGIIRIRKRQ